MSTAHQGNIRAIWTNLSSSRWLPYLDYHNQEFVTPFPKSVCGTGLCVRKMYSLLLFKFIQMARICFWCTADPTRASSPTARSKTGIEDLSSLCPFFQIRPYPLLLTPYSLLLTPTFFVEKVLTPPFLFGEKVLAQYFLFGEKVLAPTLSQPPCSGISSGLTKTKTVKFYKLVAESFSKNARPRVF